MTLRDRIAEWCLEFFGPFELTMGYFCSFCDDVHATGVKCHRELIGICVECNKWRKLDRFGNAVACGHRSIVKRQPRWPNAHKSGDSVDAPQREAV